MAACWLAGTGPLGGDGMGARKRREAGKPPLMGGGDPAWWAAALSAAAVAGVRHPSDGFGPYASAGMSVSRAMLFAALLVLASAFVKVFAVRLDGPRAAKAGPGIAAGSIAAICVQSSGLLAGLETRFLASGHPAWVITSIIPNIG